MIRPPIIPALRGMIPPGRRVIVCDRDLFRDFPAHEGILKWLTVHGIDPAELPVEQLVDVDDTARTITFDTYERDQPGAGGWVMDADTGQLKVSRRVVQLEAPALPFPDVARDWCAP